MGSSSRRGSSASNKDKEEQLNSDIPASNSTDNNPPRGFIPTLYCFRCYIKYPSYAAWRKHAVYEHIMTKNPYPIVEMNYIDPSSLSNDPNDINDNEPFGEEACNEAEEEPVEFEEISDDFVQEEVPETISTETVEMVELAELPVPTETEPDVNLLDTGSIPSGGGGSVSSLNSIGIGIGNESPKDQLKLKLCKEKGTYFVKESSVSEDSNPNSVPAPTNETEDNSNCSGTLGGDDDVFRAKETVEMEFGSILEKRLSHSPIVVMPLGVEGNVPETVEDGIIPGTVGTIETVQETIGTSPGTIGTIEAVPGTIAAEEEMIVPETLEAVPETLENVPKTLDIVPETVAETVAKPESPSASSILQQRLQRMPPPTTTIVGPEITIEIRKTGGQFQRAMSIESEVSTIFNDDEFEKALEMATERSRKFSSADQNAFVFGNVKNPSNNIPAGGGPPIPKMISTELLQNLPVIDKPLLKDKDKDPLVDILVEKPSEKEIVPDSTGQKVSAKTEAKSSQETAEDSVENEDKSEEKEEETEKSSKNAVEEETGGDGVEPESDDFECRVCHEVFESDDELEEHFSREHFRMAVGRSILEPESPYPVEGENGRGGGSIFAEDDDGDSEKIMEAIIADRRMAGDQNSAKYSAALASLLKNNQNPNVMAGMQIRAPIGRPPMGRGLTMYGQQQNTGPRPLNPNIRMGQPQILIGQQGLANNAMRPPLSSAPSGFLGAQAGPRYTMGAPRPPLHMMGQSAPGPRPSAPPQLSQRPLNYPTSLHNALITNNNINNNSLPVARPPPPNYNAGPPGYIPQRPPLRPIQQQQQQQQSNGQRLPYGQLSPTIAQQQAMLNDMNSQQRDREAIQRQQIRQQMQIRQQQQEILQQQQQQQMRERQQQQQGIPQMPRLQQYPQQPHRHQQQQQNDILLRLSQNDPLRVGQVNRAQPGEKRPATIEIIDVRNKQPRMDLPFQSNHQITISPRILPLNNNNNNNNNNANNNNNNANNNNGATRNGEGPAVLNRHVAAALGTVGSSGVNSVRLGNAITLSVCPNASDPNPNNSEQSQSNQSSRNSSGASSPVVHVNAQMSSVLAVRGVTVTPASPPITSISPASTHSNPSPSGSPSLHQQMQQNHHHQQQIEIQQQQQHSSSVIQRASPGRNFSPPVITSIRHSVGQIRPNSGNSANSSPHNFAMPRLPGPPRGPNNNGNNMVPPNAHSPSYNVNSNVDRPDRPPTVDLTDDDIQAYNNQMRQAGMPTANVRLAQQAQRTLPGAANFSIRGQRPVVCNVCGVVCSSIQGLEEHKLSRHGQRPSYVGGPRTPQTAVRSSGIQIRDVRTLNPQHLNAMRHSPPVVRAPPSPLRAQAPSAQQQQQNQYQMRQTTSSPSRPQGSSSPAGKYLYIPLLDLNRLDPTKMSRLEEIGITCIVPLHGNNSSLSQMGIPVMNLRADGLTSQHVPWDSVLPMGPVHQSVSSMRSPNMNGPRSQQ